MDGVQLIKKKVECNVPYSTLRDTWLKPDEDIAPYRFPYRAGVKGKMFWEAEQDRGATEIGGGGGRSPAVGFITETCIAHLMQDDAKCGLAWNNREIDKSLRNTCITQKLVNEKTGKPYTFHSDVISMRKGFLGRAQAKGIGFTAGQGQGLSDARSSAMCAERVITFGKACDGDLVAFQKEKGVKIKLPNVMNIDEFAVDANMNCLCCKYFPDDGTRDRNVATWYERAPHISVIGCMGGGPVQQRLMVIKCGKDGNLPHPEHLQLTAGNKPSIEAVQTSNAWVTYETKKSYLKMLFEAPENDIGEEGCAHLLFMDGHISNTGQVRHPSPCSRARCAPYSPALPPLALPARARPRRRSPRWRCAARAGKSPTFCAVRGRGPR